MEQHPVPQNVTTFQFRLIGDMTLKQFGYLAGGLIIGYICYKLPLPFFFTWPLALIFGLGGIGFAFVPIEERPMDVWVLSFFKSIYSPTQYVWNQTASKNQVTTDTTPPPQVIKTQEQVVSQIFKPKIEQPTPIQHPAEAVLSPPPPPKPSVQIIQPDQAISVGLIHLTTFPNVVTGIVKDSEKNLLPGVLITVKDGEGMPLRALKTNRLGQFAASTPLSNGVYFVEIEDPRNRYIFDRAQITLNGTIVPALEIVAKGQKEISREKLTKEIFGDAK